MTDDALIIHTARHRDDPSSEWPGLHVRRLDF